VTPSLAAGARDYRRPCSRSSWAGRVLTVAEHGLPSTTPVSPANSPGPTVPSTTSPPRNTDLARREADLAHPDLPEPAPAAPRCEGPIGSTPDEGGAFPGPRQRPACRTLTPSSTFICHNGRRAPPRQSFRSRRSARPSNRRSLGHLCLREHNRARGAGAAGYFGRNADGRVSGPRMEERRPGFPAPASPPGVRRRSRRRRPRRPISPPARPARTTAGRRGATPRRRRRHRARSGPPAGGNGRPLAGCGGVGRRRAPAVNF